MALIKIKLSSGEVRYLNDTEYTGVCSTGILDPKCFPKNFDDTLAVRGISRLWATNTKVTESAIIETQSAKLKGKANKKYFHLLLHSWFDACNRSLELGLKPIFRREVEIRSSLRGKPDFYKTESLNKGMLGATVSVVSRLGFDLPELMVIRDAYEFALRNDDLLPVDPEMRSRMVSTLSRGLSALNGVPKSDNVRKNALDVIQRISSSSQDESAKDLARLPPKLRHLSQTSTFCAKLLLNRNEGVDGSEFGQSGLLLNMNYLLQHFLKNTCLSKAEPNNKSEFFKGTNFITDGIGMYPDITGINPDGTHFILDAKHKIFIDETSTDERGHKKSKGQTHSDNSSAFISREDFHQIISYSTTHHYVPNRTYYGLIGLWKTKEPLKNGYFNASVLPSRIKYRGKGNTTNEIVISRIAINFAKILHEVGNETNIGKLYSKLYDELFLKLSQDLGSIDFQESTKVG